MFNLTEEERRRIREKLRQQMSQKSVAQKEGNVAHNSEEEGSIYSREGGMCYNTIVAHNSFDTYREERDLSYYLLYLSSLPPGYRFVHFRADESFIARIDEVARELGLSRSKFVKTAVLVFLDALGKLEPRNFEVKIQLHKLDAERKPIELLLRFFGIKKRIGKVRYDERSKTVVIRFADGTWGYIHLEAEQRKLEIARHTSWGSKITLEEYLIPDDVRIEVEG